MMNQAWESFQKSTDGNIGIDYTEFCINWLKENNSADLIQAFFPSKVENETTYDYDFVKKVIALDFLNVAEKMDVLDLRISPQVLKVEKKENIYKLIRFRYGEKTYEVTEN